MKILITNDDGIGAEGLWSLVRELQGMAQVVVVAPHREQSAIGTAVSLLQELRVQPVRPPVAGVDTYAVEGTPSDCVILGLSKIISGGVDMVVSGINHGANVGDDVFISGTVAAALQGYIHGRHALAVSMARPDNGHLGNGARLAARLVRWVESRALPDNVFLNVNLPARPIGEISGAVVTRLANSTHIDSAEESDNDGRGYYRLVRRQSGNYTAEETDVWALDQGHISLTPLHAELLNRPKPLIPEDLGLTLLRELKGEVGLPG